MRRRLESRFPLRIESGRRHRAKASQLPARILSQLFKTAGIAASVLALFCLLGGHWFALQSVAWAQMLARFSKTESITEAIQNTFDGEHPCKMCLRIREGRQQEERDEEKAPLTKTEKSPDWICDLRRVSAPPPPRIAEEAVGFVPRPNSDFISSPPSPPPRFFLAVV